MECQWKSCTNRLSGRQKSFCSSACKSKFYVSENRRKNKRLLVEEAGGKCVDCGIEGPAFLFDFDHREPEAKGFGVSHGGNSWSLSRLREEVQKCDLVCANCHRFRTHYQRCDGCEYCTHSGKATAG